MTPGSFEEPSLFPNALTNILYISVKNCGHMSRLSWHPLASCLITFTQHRRRRCRPPDGEPANTVESATSPASPRNRRNRDWTEGSPDRSLAAAPWPRLSPRQSHRHEVVSARWSSQDRK